MTTPKTVRVDVVSLDDGWRLTYGDGQGGELAPPRQLRRVGTTPWSFPLPPLDESQRLADGSAHKALCLADDEEPLIDALASLLSRQPGSDAVVTIGRYLFSVLLGEAWPKVLEAEEPPLSLELHWPADDTAFGRFPWDLLHDGQGDHPSSGFLTLRDGVTLQRRVDGPADTVAPAVSPLDVLFVVGRNLQDDTIRPAAEYLALLQSLDAVKLKQGIRPRLLLEATAESLKAALAERRPAVVHFITHGRHGSKRPYLELHDPTAKAPAELYASNLLDLLKASDAPLPVVVLSACDTANAKQMAKQGDTAAPFAAELVSGGVPMAVGMSGPVADLACRLFTRAFYVALLSGQDAATAAAAGRRAAKKYGAYDPLTTYDWALPTLFVSTRLKSSRLAIAEAPLAVERQKLANELQPGKYPVFCDRLSILAATEALMAGGQTRQTLALATDDASIPGIEERFGRTWTLRALAARATLAGHVPCVVSSDYILPGQDPPTDWASFVELLSLAIEKTATELGIDHCPCRISKFLLGGSRPDDLPKELKDIKDPPTEPKTLDLARALRLDALSFLQVVRSKLPEADRPKCRLLLLVDDLHRMGDLTSELLDYGLGPFGLRLCRNDVRLVFTWARKGMPYQATVQRIVDWLGEHPTEDLSLTRFEGLEERLAYQHFLYHFMQLGKSLPLAVARETATNQPHIDAFWEEMEFWVEGIPSKLRAAETAIGVYVRSKTNTVVQARDEDALQQWLAEGAAVP